MGWHVPTGSCPSEGSLKHPNRQYVVLKQSPCVRHSLPTSAEANGVVRANASSTAAATVEAVGMCMMEEGEAPRHKLVFKLSGKLTGVVSNCQHLTAQLQWFFAQFVTTLNKRVVVWSTSKARRESFAQLAIHDRAKWGKYEAGCVYEHKGPRQLHKQSWCSRDASNGFC
eukprot:m.170527 g.170527  ORF g.170527 m.170527 type:complete len:170 (-) comp17830_c3_seq1:460-969(-)